MSIPSFWLKVRKEYIFDNLDEMIEYLRLCPFSSTRPNPDFENTLKCLNEVINDWRECLEKTPIFKKPDTGGRKEIVYIRLMVAALLASHKKGVTQFETITTLIKTFLAFELKIDNNTWEKLWNLAIACARGCKVEKYALNWNDIKTSETAISFLAYQLAQTNFKTTGGPCRIENHGVATIDENSLLHIAPMNTATYIKTNLKHLFEIESLLVVEDREEVKKNDFTKLEIRGRQIMNSMDSVSASPSLKLKDYGPDDIIPIRIVKKNGISTYAETIDPLFNRLEGKVKLERMSFRPDNIAILSSLEEGDYVLSRLNSSSDFMFDLTDELDETYKNLGDDFASKIDFAVLSGQSTESSILQFITAHGLRVMLHRNKLDELEDGDREEFLEKAKAQLPVAVRFYTQPHRGENNYKLYVQPALSIYETIPSSLNIAEADTKFVQIMKADAEAYIEDLPKQVETMPKLSPQSVNLLSHLLYFSAEEAGGSPLSRLKDLLAAAMLSKIGGQDVDVRFLMFRISELGRIVAFCNGKGEIKDMSVDPELNDCPRAAESLELIKILKSYCYPSSPMSTSRTTIAEDRNIRVQKLVESSNSLRYILDAKELNNIKYAIAKTLDAEEEFVHIVDNSRTFYGVESISLEFKKSIVFPPKNRRRSLTTIADPELQKWAILKTVCGFLNSRSGGELILGVNDDGYAEGVDDDINELFIRKLISKPDIDHYRHYVQHQVDYAFREYGAPTQSIDITSLNISYEAEINPEGKNILRIKVKPYPYGAVAFLSDINLPEGYKESYVRKDGMTRELTQAIRTEIEKYKLDTASSDSRNLVLLSHAIETKTIAILHGYTSASGIADREIEVYKVWKNRGLILGYDLKRKDIRVFKINRAESVELTNRHWSTEHGRKNRQIDPFGMLLDESNIETIELNLTDYGKLLLKETIPSASIEEIRNPGSEKRWRYTCKVSSLHGIGRFCLGLPREVEIVNGDNLKNYLRNMIKSFI